ncbi:hypothetical protein [Acidithiobacillus ferriphilus]|uniref:hypothetical protein n=1 Tax=Acidithiobacillus ferriphilus TaxID=1689834 RepID=UPI002DBB4F54|nr:hypothetical protein [Acidithiobacillus ferriphilus]MEB8534678.1 DUF3617 family protein [Acidithiobacillus ferriphilus]
MRFIQTALIMMLLASPVLVHASTLHRGEWKATERTAQGVQETYTYCDRGQGWAGLINHDAGSSCSIPHPTVLRSGGRVQFTEKCLLRTPPNGEATTQMRVELQMSDGGRAFHATITGTGTAGGYQFPISEQVSGHYIGACHQGG